MKPSPACRYRFGPCTYDPTLRELLYAGVRLQLPLQEATVLTCLLDHPGEVVQKATFAALLWPEQQYGDTDRAITTLISKVRRLHPKGAEWIETITKAGYRLTIQVQREDTFDSSPVEISIEKAAAPLLPAPLVRIESLLHHPGIWVTMAMLVLVAFLVFFVRGASHTASAAPRPLVLGVLPFSCSPADREDGETLREQIADALAGMPGTEVRSTHFLKDLDETHLEQIAGRLHSDVFLSGRFHLDGDVYRLDLEMIRSPDGIHLGSLHYQGSKAQMAQAPERISFDLARTLQKATPELRPQYLLGSTNNSAGLRTGVSRPDSVAAQNEKRCAGCGRSL